MADTTLEIEDVDIQKVLQAYKKKREYERERYHTVIKKDPVLMERRREIARQHYYDNIDKKREYYRKNKDIQRLQRMAKKYTKEELSEKFPEEYSVMLDINIL